MNRVVAQRCLNHAQREAVARCPGCGRFFCRECVSEHEDRVLCATCLAAVARVPLLRRRGFAGALRLAQGLLGLLAAWFFFYLAGQALLSLPSSFHEGSIWPTAGKDGGKSEMMRREGNLGTPGTAPLPSAFGRSSSLGGEKG